MRWKYLPIAAPSGYRFADEADQRWRVVRLKAGAYFQPLDLRVNRAGSAGLAGGAGSSSPDAAEISRSSSSSLVSPASWSTNISECCDGISNFLPQVLHVTSSSRRSR